MSSDHCFSRNKPTNKNHIILTNFRPDHAMAHFFFLHPTVKHTHKQYVRFLREPILANRMHATWLWRMLKRRSILCNLLALLMNFTTTKHEKKNICDHDIIHYIVFRSIILRWCRGFLSSLLALSHSLSHALSFFFFGELYGWLLWMVIAYLPIHYSTNATHLLTSWSN